MYRLVPVFLTLLLLAGCAGSGGDSQEGGDSQKGGDATTGQGAARVLSMEEFTALPAETQYAVVNKLTATLYKGVPVAQFFDMTVGLDPLVVQADAPTLETLAATLDTPLTNLARILDFINGQYFFDERRLRNTRAFPMALLWELPLSREYFYRWIAYKLANTILFSPAQEQDSVSHVDVLEVYNRLSLRLDQGVTIREIVEEHLNSQANWRRFRSPEDNTREMMELFLDRFRDDEVPLASQACKNWFITDASQGYQLIKTQEINTESLSLLDTGGIVTCEDFYREVAAHADLIPTVIARVMEEFFPTADAAAKTAFMEAIVASSPTTFQEIYRAMLFSRIYLLETSRTRQFEEAYFPVAERIDWFAHQNVFHDLNDGNPGDNPPDLSEMQQETMTFEIGRPAIVPLDSLSFAFYHKSLRNTLLLDRRTTSDPDSTRDGGWRGNFIAGDAVMFLSDEDFVHYLFLSVLSRKASAAERTSLLQLFEVEEVEGRLRRTMITFDYLSRLSELYAFKPIN